MILVLIIIAFFVNLVIRRALKRVIKRIDTKMTPAAAERAITLTKTAGSVISYAIFFAVVVGVLTILGIIKESQALLGTGIVGLAVAFGSQTLVKDVVSGFFVLLEEQYGVGDVVEINGKLGVIEEIGLRVTRMRNVKGQLFFFPNGSIGTINRFPDDGIGYELHIPTATEKKEEVKTVAQQALIEFNNLYAVLEDNPQFDTEKQVMQSYTILIYDLKLSPLHQDIATEKLTAWLSRYLKQTGHPLPEGSEISLTPAL